MDPPECETPTDSRSWLRIIGISRDQQVLSEPSHLHLLQRQALRQVGRDRLPVVDGMETRRYVGELSAGDIIFLYSQEVLKKESRLARFDRLVEGGRPETTYVELPGEYVVAMVKLPESFEGTTLRELDARRRFGVNVIEVQRHPGTGREHRLIPGPDTELKGGDGLIVVGRPSDIEHLGDPARLAEISSKPAPPS